MGGISSAVSTIFGGKQAKDQSGNLAYPGLSSALSGSVGTGSQATGLLGTLLGLGGDQGAANSSFQNYLNGVGYQNQVNAGTSAITGNAAAKGLLGSGGTLKAISNYGQQSMGQAYQQYLSNLLGLGTQGNQAASVLSDAGKESSGSSSENKGLLAGIGGLI